MACDAVATFTVDAQGRLTAAADRQSHLSGAVSDFIRKYRQSIDQLATPADVSIKLQLTDVDPTAAQDGDKNYVDSVASGLDVKTCHVATTGNINPNDTDD